jgi:hypothetical protein
MSHKLVSNQAVVYNAQTQASSILTITPQATSFNDNAPTTSEEEAHTVSVSSIVWVEYGTSEQQYIDRINFVLDSITWDNFYDSQKSSFLTTSSYDNTLETVLEYIKLNLTPLYGLPSSSWTIEM